MTRGALLFWLVCGVSALYAQTATSPAKLAIVRPVLSEGEGGPALPAGYQFVSGEPLYLNFRISGYKVVKDRVDVRWHLIATDPEGILIFPAINGAFREEVSAADDNWQPRVQQTLTLPDMLPGGTYRLRLRIADEYAKTGAEHDLEFRVRGPSFEPPGKVAIRNIRFYREETSRSPADPPVYVAGATVWIRFDLVGYSIGEGNKFDVQYGVSVLRPSGKPLFEQPQAASEGAAPFYPKRAMFGGFNLTTTPDLSPGEYVLVIRAKDNLGNQEVEERAVFQVRQ